MLPFKLGSRLLGDCRPFDFKAKYNEESVIHFLIGHKVHPSLPKLHFSEFNKGWFAVQLPRVSNLFHVPSQLIDVIKVQALVDLTEIFAHLFTYYLEYSVFDLLGSFLCVRN